MPNCDAAAPNEREAETGLSVVCHVGNFLQLSEKHLHVYRACGPQAARTAVGQLPELIMPAPTVTPVASSMRINEPVARFFE